jgi:hypothetical protein
MGDAESAFGSNGFQMMGIMNALKTGDVHVVRIKIKEGFKS